MAVMRESIEDRVRFVFEDAQIRAFRADALDVLELVDLPESDAAALYSKLHRKKAPSGTPRTRGKPVATAKLPSFERQLAIFTNEFPQGFEDPRYESEERGTRTELISKAQQQLSRAAMQRAVEGNAHAHVYEVARALMRGGRDAFSSGRGKDKPLRRDQQTSFVRALNRLLHGSEPYEARFDAWITAMRSAPTPTWSDATYLQALVHPTTQVFVRRSFWRAQATILELSETSQALPSGSAHVRFGQLAQDLNTKLTKAGQKPRDLWDAHSFVWRTLGPRREPRAAAG